MTAIDWAIIATGIGTAFSALAALGAVIVTWKVHKSQKLLNQRQLLLPLWGHISQLSEVNPKSPITPDVIKLVNTLELVALCCEGGLIDEKVILRTFREQFMNHYMAIEACGAIPGLSKNGKQLLMENRAASNFYRKLLQDHISQGQISGQP
ncbi:MAG: hypothetical protein KA204_02995 [Chromatiaceae bacterium]|nr:hypothetical protein [Chromatiaceae bacterium]MBP6806867.1 hypothetical protein [Chromatiaceae bacterium]